MIYFTSDLHFCHDRDFIYTPRGAKSVEHMNQMIVENWNKTVQQNDIVYILGDITLMDDEKGIHLYNRLNGTKYILFGNHDTTARRKLYAEQPNTIVVGYADTLKYKGFNFYMSHYPTITTNGDDDKPLTRHVINLFGHTHQTDNFYNGIPYIYHVGLDSHNNTPVSIDEVIKDCQKEYEKFMAKKKSA